LLQQIVADAVTYMQEERGMPNFLTGERAVTALAGMADYTAQISKLKASSAAPQVLDLKLPGEGQMLEPEAMAWLQENGFPVPAFRFSATQEEAVHSCDEIGYPVVMKVVSPEILHKSDYGGVIVGIEDERAARSAFDTIQQAAQGKDFRGVIIYPLVRDAQEVLLGLSRDPQFGPVVAFGLGGIYTEVWRDLSLRVAPIDRAEAEGMIRELRSFPLLQGVRGQAQRDLDALADVLVEFSRLPFRYPKIGEVDLNPVFLLEEGLVVGDVRVIRAN
jgi:acetyltransferase